ncbi:MAG: hypothetical protein JWM81_468 [Candidatus Saccharibacteria bacterium]|nr:hypothetical protein [Candidatus Saccharibacteria bacterium]
MVTPNIILAAIVLVPIVLLMVLRINAALVFLSLCLGNVLVQYVSDDAKWFMDMFGSSHATQTVAPGNNLIKVILLLLPTVLTAIFMIRTVKGARLILNVLPAAGVGLLGSLLVVPLLASGLSHDIVSSPLWKQAQMAQDLIVGTSALVCLLVLWLQRPKSGSLEKHHGHHE